MLVLFTSDSKFLKCFQNHGVWEQLCVFFFLFAAWCVFVYPNRSRSSFCLHMLTVVWWEDVWAASCSVLSHHYAVYALRCMASEKT